jgi:hypothetical protein
MADAACHSAHLIAQARKKLTGRLQDAEVYAGASTGRTRWGKRLSGLIREPAHVASIEMLRSPYRESINFGANNLSQASKGVVERVLAIANPKDPFADGD